MKRGHPSFLKKTLYGLGALLILAVVFSLVMSSCAPPGDTYPSWSPDGTRIAFSHDSEIWVMNADGTNQTKLTSDGYNPDWSPDGTKIVFNREGHGYCDVWIMNADGSNEMNLTNRSGWYVRPVWSPDVSRIAFVKSKGNSSYIWVMNADGTNQVKLTK